MMKRLLALAVLVSGIMLPAGAQTGTWSGSIEVRGIRLPMVFHLDGDNPTVDSPAQGAKGIPIQVERTQTGAVTVRMPSAGAVFEGVWIATKIVGTFTQSGMSFPLTLTPGEPGLNRPQTPRGPFPYRTEELSFDNAGAVLRGTLTLPEGCTRSTPVLIMVTGSGLQNRDEELFGHKPFAVIADALAREGIATLRYDDRGFGESTGDPVNCTTEDLKNDALAGIRALRESFDRVGVLGHSEGGTIALMLAAEAEADFIISLAGMAVSGAETLVWQSRLAFASAGIPEPAVDAYCRLISEAFDVSVNGGRMPVAEEQELPEALKDNYRAVLMQIQSPYMAYFLSLDVRPLLGGITCPVLALNGTRDTQVEYSGNLAALRAGLPANPANRIEALEGLNHLFQHCVTGAVTEYAEIEETFAPEALGTMAQWVKSLFE